ncbi:LysE family transporter [Spirochaeta isovalerica]|uniref:Threonine/homoserine/homoserine lactone efflux protein n=1 Tax=Spirochaeta isovalerica TaxID=150 RepID=A0A841R977_9SPIO|nr:LysE family transporter [Spirochaeta isovalerica]MBB6480455.1 threonine/homoserine/homoserine lactone efflux protein [Spirochaeta isovalerica]
MFQLLPFLSYAVAMTFSPGPNNLMSMFNSGRDGYVRTLGFMAGIFTGFFFIMLFSAYLNLALYTYIPQITSIMKYIGAAYLLYLAWKVSGIRFGGKASDKVEEESSGTVNSFRVGMTMQLVNVKVILYGLTILSGFVIPYYRGPVRLTLFSVLLASFSFLSINSWALFGSLFRKIISRHKRFFNLLMSVLLLYSALAVSHVI